MASPPEATNAPPWRCSTWPPAATDATASTTPGPHRWPGRPDGAGFFYTRYPDPGSVEPGEDEYGRHVRYHRLGSPPSLDPVVWDDLPDPTAWATVDLSRDGRWLLFHLSVGWQRTDVHLLDRRTKAHTVLIEGVDARTALQVVDDQVIGVTTLDADRGRVVSAPLTSAWHDHWCTVVPESDAVIEAAAVTPASLLVLSTRSAITGLDRYEHDGTGRRTITLPEVGSASALSASPDRDEAFVAMTSFTTPPTTYRWAGDTADDVQDWSRLREQQHGGDGPQGHYVADTDALPLDGRHRDHAVRGALRRHRPRPGHPLRPHRLRRVLDRHGSGLLSRRRRRVRPRRDLRRRRHPRRRRRGRGMAPRRHESPQGAELRRLRRRRRLARRPGLHVEGTPGDPGRLERWPAHGSHAHPTPRPVSRGSRRGAADGHAPLPPVPHRTAVGARSTATPTWPRSSGGSGGTRPTTT